MGRALLFPSRLRTVEPTEGATVVRLDGVRLECFPYTPDGKPIDKLTGKLVSAWSEFDGSIRFTAIPRNLEKELGELMDWRFPNA